MKGAIWKTAAAGACLALALPTLGARAEEWVLSENGKYWMYYYAPGRPAEDQWIQYEGKEYYLDRSGHMKTGWMTDPDSGEKVYLGPDGAKAASVFAEDGKYVGSDSREAAAFNKYLKAAEKTADDWLSQVKKTSSPVLWLGWEDLDGDGFRDLSVSQGDGAAPVRLLGVYIWDSDSQELNASFETDIEDGGTWARLLREKENRELWLEILEGDSCCAYFSLGDAGPVFENQVNYTMEVDEWGMVVYLENGDETDRDTWAKSREATRARLEEAGLRLSPAADQEAVTAALKVGLTPQEALLWEE